MKKAMRFVIDKGPMKDQYVSLALSVMLFKIVLLIKFVVLFLWCTVQESYSL